MSMTLDRRIDEALGGEACAECEPHVHLELSEDCAGAMVEALRWALYGGAAPPDGRRALLVMLDALTLGMSGA